MVAFWRRNKDRRADLCAEVAKALGTQAHEFNVSAIVRDLMRLDKPHEWQIWTAIHQHDSLPGDRAA